MNEEDLPKDLVGNDLYLDGMDVSSKVHKRTELKDYHVLMEILDRNEKQLRNLWTGDRTNGLPSDVEKRIKTAHKKVNSALRGVMERFETEYDMKANQWRKEVD